MDKKGLGNFKSEQRVDNDDNSEQDLIDILRGLRLERAENRRDYESRETELNYQIAEAEIELQSRRDASGTTPVISNPSSVSTNQVSLPAETQRVTRERPRDIRDQSTQLPRKIRVGDWVIITSGTGGLRGTRAQVVEIKTRSYELAIPGVEGTIIRRKASVIPDTS